MHGIREGIHESRTGFEDRVGAGGIALFRFSLPLGDVYATRACVVYDAQPLRHARRLLASLQYHRKMGCYVVALFVFEKPSYLASNLHSESDVTRAGTRRGRENGTPHP